MLNRKPLLKLLSLIVVCPLLAWQFGIGRTLKVWQNYREIQNRVAMLQPDTLSVMNKSNDTGKPMVSNGEILEQISEITERNGIKVVRYTPFFTEKESDYILYTGELVLSGSYIPLMEVVEFLKAGLFPKLISVCYRLQNDRRNKQKTVLLTLIIQQIEYSPKNRER